MVFTPDRTDFIHEQVRDAVEALVTLAETTGLFITDLDTLATAAKQDTAQTTRAAVLAALGPYTSCVSTRLTLGASATLPTLKGSALLTGLKEVLIVPEDSTENNRMNVGGAATATTAKIPPTGVGLPVNKAVADTIQLYAASTQYVTLIELA